MYTNDNDPESKQLKYNKLIQRGQCMPNFYKYTLESEQVFSLMNSNKLPVRYRLTYTI